jgi:hypothetical protein
MDEANTVISEEGTDAGSTVTQETEFLPVVDPVALAQQEVAEGVAAMTEHHLPGHVLAILTAPYPGGSPSESPADALPHHEQAARAVGKELHYVRSRYQGQPVWYVLLCDPVPLDEDVTSAIIAKRIEASDA